MSFASFRARAKDRTRALWTRLGGGELSPWRAAASVAVGLAVGVTPLWGTHTLIVLAVCVPLRLDARLAYIASNVSLPFFAPFISALEVQIGSYVITGHRVAMDAREIALHARELPFALAVGTGVLSPSAATGGGALTFAVASAARWVSTRRAGVTGS